MWNGYSATRNQHLLGALRALSRTSGNETIVETARANSLHASVGENVQESEDLLPPQNGNKTAHGQQMTQHPFKPVLWALQWFGLYPCMVSRVGEGPEMRWTLISVLVTMFFTMITLISFFINIGFFALNVYVTNRMVTMGGILHPMTMTSIITGLLPLQNAINMCLFWLRIKSHRILLYRIETIVQAAYTSPEERKMLSRGVRKVFIILGLTILIPFVLRLVQCVLQPGILHKWHRSGSLIIVPLLRGWQVLPLIYFNLLCTTAASLFKQIRRTIVLDPDFRAVSATRHFKRFNHVTHICRRISLFLSPFMFVSLVLATLNLCLAIYFAYNAKNTLNELPDLNTARGLDAAFDIGWGCLQVIITVAYALFICKSGWLANEQARNVIQSVLTANPYNEITRFEILRFQELLKTQVAWGINVFEVLKIDRNAFFTMSTTVIGYAFILLRMKPKDDNDFLKQCLDRWNVTEFCQCIHSTRANTLVRLCLNNTR